MTETALADGRELYNERVYEQFVGTNNDLNDENG